MLLHRRILFVVTCLFVLGSISLTLGYAIHIHSDKYREQIAFAVSDFLTLPTTIDGVVPQTHASRGFLGIRVFTPGQEIQIFECDRATWSEQTQNGDAVNVLDVHDGWLLLDSSRMGGSDYRQLLEGGLAHDFSILKLAAVEFHNIDIRWQQPQLKLATSKTTGTIQFESDGLGRAKLESHSLNGTTVDEPIVIHATFTQGDELDFHNIVLDVPSIPLSSMALDDIAGAAVTQGNFEGEVAFRPSETEQIYRVRGSVVGARLEELTARIPGGPVRGNIHVTLSEAQLSPGVVRGIVFDGGVDEIKLADLGKVAGAPELDGNAELRIERCRYHDERLERLDLTARAQDVPAEAITKLIGRGRITGIADVRINSLVVDDNRLRWADIDVNVTPPPNAKGLIDREVILNAAKEALGVDLGRAGKALPASVEYSRLGCKLIIDGDRMTVKGSHGKNNQTILTIKTFLGEVGILKAPRTTYAVAPLIERIQNELRGLDLERYLRRGPKK